MSSLNDSLDDDSEDRSTGDRNWKRRSGKEKEQQGQGQEVNSQVPGGSGNGQKSGPGVANEARAVAGVDSISQGRDPMEGINQYGSNAAASDTLLRSLERGKSTEKATSTQGLSGEGKTLGASFDLAVEEAEGTQVSAETGSHLTEQVSSWLLDSPIRSLLDSQMDPLGEEGEVVEAIEGPAMKGAPADLQQEMSASISLAKGKRTKIVVVPEDKVAPVRKSSRNKGAEANTPSMAKAQRLTTEKNLDKGNDFAILDLHSDAHLSSVVQDSCILFVPSTGTPSVALSLIRAKEAVQAALAETRARLEREAATKAAGDAAAVADRAAMPAPNEGPGEPSGVAAMAGREGLAEVGLDAAQGGAAQDLGEEVSAAGEARAVSSALRSKPRRKCVTQSTLSVRKGRGSKSRN
jgi:hypothetical protein